MLVVMASSIPSAIIEMWNAVPVAAFGGSERPPLRLNRMPQTKADSSQQRIPYATLFDEGIRPTYDSSYGGTEGGTVRLEMYAFPLDVTTEVSAVSMAMAAKYGGQHPSRKAGLDWGTLPLVAYHYPISLKRISEQYTEAGYGRDVDGSLRVIHKAVLEYRVVVGLNAVSAGSWSGFFGLITYP